jgi:2-aminoadipate transaminase
MNIVIDKGGASPIYRQIHRQIREMILSGELPTGYRLPPERRLAEALDIARTTVINAYEELKSEGLVDARVGHGTVVSPPRQPYPEASEGRSVSWSHYFRDEGLRPPDPLVRNLLEAASRPDVISFAIGLPSPADLPLMAFDAASKYVIEEAGPQALLQTPTEGFAPLRESISRWLVKRGMVCGSDEVLVLSGSQQGLHLAARVFLNPGDTVIVEAPTYFGAMEAFRRAGVRLLAVPTDIEGMQVDVLTSLLRHHRPKLIYVQSSFQNPSGAVMSLDRRRQLLQLATRYGIPVLEDDTYSELRYEGTPVPSLKALDSAGIVMMLGTFSKVLFPGLRLGWLVAPRMVIHQFALAKQTEDLHAGTFAQMVVDRMIRHGDLDVHIARSRTIYRERRDLMAVVLERHAVDGMSWKIPEGGFYFWCDLPRRVDRTRLSENADDERVSFLPGYPCFAEDPPSSQIRLSFSFPPEDSIEEGIMRLMRAVKGSFTTREHGWERHHSTTRPLV